MSKKAKATTPYPEIQALVEPIVRCANNKYLTIAYLEAFEFKDFFQWSEEKIVVFQIDDNYIRVDYEHEKMDGDKAIIEKIKAENKKLQGKILRNDYPHASVHRLFNGWTLFDVIEHAFPESKVSKYVVEYFPENPLEKLMRDYLKINEEILAEIFPLRMY